MVAPSVLLRRSREIVELASEDETSDDVSRPATIQLKINQQAQSGISEITARTTRYTTNRAGNINRINGNNMVTGSFAAISSAF